MYDVHAGPMCDKAIDYSTGRNRGCMRSDPCGACRAAQRAASARQSEIRERRAAAWLAGMQARDERIARHRRDGFDVGPTDIEQLEDCEVGVGRE